MKIKVLNIVIILIILFLLFLSILVSPYKFEYEPELKQVNDSSVLVLRFFYILIMLLNIVGVFISKLKRKIFLSFYVITFIFVFISFVKLFYL
jgi:hypothetical protein